MKTVKKKRLVINKFRCVTLLIIMFIFVSGLRIVDFTSFYMGKESKIEYTVKKNDTLWSISEEYKPSGMDKREYLYKIAKMNNLQDSNDEIYPGDVLEIPIWR